MSLAGRTALVTGGGTGLGAVLATALADAGAVVWIAGRRGTVLDDLARGHPRLRAAPVDVTDAASVAALFDRVGRPEIVVANAGAPASAPLAGTAQADWDATLAVNLTGAFLTLREAARRLGRADYGRLVVIASTAGLKGYAYAPAFTAAKHGAIGLVRATALELARTGITVNALCPAFLNTEALDTLEPSEEPSGAEDPRAALAALSPQNRLIEPAEVARALLWLCDPAARGVTGQAIPIAGGEV